MKKIFVTGGTGFIGKNIVEVLMKHYQVFVLTRRHTENFGNVKFLQGEISDSGLLETFMAEMKPDILMHLAWNVADGGYAQSAENNDWVLWSGCLVDCFLKHGGRTVVGAGTCFEYDATSREPLREDSPCNPMTVYGKAKLQTYHLLEEKCGEANARFVWGRIFYPYGVGEEQRKLFSSVILNLKDGRPFYCRAADHIIDYIHVKDVAGLFLKFIENDDMEGIFNVGSGKGYKIEDLIITIAKQLDKEELVHLKNADNHISIISDNEKIKKLHYEFQYDIEEGLKELTDKT